MSFFAEVSGKLGLKDAGHGYNMINYNGEALYVEGFRKVLQIESDRIVFDCKKHAVTVIGRNLTVSELEPGCAVIKGTVTRVDSGWDETPAGAAAPTEDAVKEKRRTRESGKKSVSLSEFFGRRE